MPMPACATAERGVFSCIDQNKETNRREQDNEEVFKIIGKKSSFPSSSSVKVF
jgi:hypothetical protein